MDCARVQLLADIPGMATLELFRCIKQLASAVSDQVHSESEMSYLDLARETVSIRARSGVSSRVVNKDLLRA
jgi:hypothetical protein